MLSTNKLKKNCFAALIGTPQGTSSAIQHLAGGQYWHFGLEEGLRSCFANIQQSTTIHINVNIDGIPIFENGTAQFWPILFNVHDQPHIRPLIIGLFYGHHKPTKVEEFLDAFVNEAVQVLQSGLSINGHHLKVKFRAFICDSPARSFIKGIYSHCSRTEIMVFNCVS